MLWKDVNGDHGTCSTEGARGDVRQCCRLTLYSTQRLRSSHTAGYHSKWQGHSQDRPPRAHAVNCLSTSPGAGLRPENQITTDSSEVREHDRRSHAHCSQQHATLGIHCRSVCGLHSSHVRELCRGHRDPTTVAAKEQFL